MTDLAHGALHKPYAEEAVPRFWQGAPQVKERVDGMAPSKGANGVHRRSAGGLRKRRGKDVSQTKHTVAFGN